MAKTLAELGTPLLKLPEPAKVLRRGDPGYWELSEKAKRDIEAIERHYSPLLRQIVLD